MQEKVERVRVQVSGIVQGVGFRPYIYKLATRHSLTGFVQNSGGSVDIEIQGGRGSIENFLRELPSNAPPLAKVSEVSTRGCQIISTQNTFKIKKSVRTKNDNRAVPPDAATCTDCLHELLSTSDRRFLYPFINCINCGPRFTVIQDLPYDRVETTMKSFKMCRECQKEYTDASDRRFHAQPIACKHCGPQLRFQSANLDLKENFALDACITALKDNRVVVIKNLGGYQLVANALSAEPATEIRSLKRRRFKPLAVLFRDPSHLKEYCLVTEEEQENLQSPARPIVLLDAQETNSRVSVLLENVAPSLDRIGAMLPSTPLQYLISDACDFPLIVTSANDSGLPIIISDEEARARFEGQAILSHDREISSGYDDSILRVRMGKPLVVRRARGMAPGEIPLPFSCTKSVLAFGAHFKSTFCLAQNKTARLSQHLGDLDTIEQIDNFHKTLNLYQKLFDFKPDLIARDLHPQYETSRLAEQFGDANAIPVIAVQHHHAHAVAVMAEHGLKDALAIVLDGYGYGSDENGWGGEILHCTYNSFNRLGHLQNLSMPGGDLCARQPWRMTVSCINEAVGESEDQFELFYANLRAQKGDSTVDGIKKLLKSKLQMHKTSSAGRLFDAIAALINPDCNATYEAQAAIELEALARQCHCKTEHVIDMALNLMTIPNLILSTTIILSIQSMLNDGYPRCCAARAFHDGLARAIANVVISGSNPSHSKHVVLAGGVFQNELLSVALERKLRANGFEVYLPKQLPTNDGGLSYGQSVVAMSTLLED